MHLIHRKTCRVCGSASLTRVIGLGEQFLQGAFVKDGLPLPPLRTDDWPLESQGKLVRVAGLVHEATGIKVPLGSVCRIQMPSSGNDWASAWATNSEGRPIAAVVPGGERQRETAYRFGVNVVMYTMTGNYKTDVVHAPALLQRLGNER